MLFASLKKVSVPGVFFAAGTLLVGSIALAPGSASAKEWIYNTPCLQPATISVDPNSGKVTWTCVVHPNGATVSTDNPDAYREDLEPLVPGGGGGRAGAGGTKNRYESPPILVPRIKPNPQQE